MRPVVKKNAGDTMSYFNAQDEQIDHIVQTDYIPYHTAKLPLIANLGTYCSYCEIYNQESDIAVEHIQPKDAGGPITQWNNFLLGCRICNSDKPKAALNPNDFHWPHQNNTFLSFVYDQTGRVKVNPSLSGASKTRAQNLLRLVKLDRHPQSLDNRPSDMDFRWRGRYEAWKIASRYKAVYDRSLLPFIIDCAKTKGFWSVWFTVFQGNDEVRKALIDAFPGTATCCFDANNHYEPINRNVGAPDPI